MNHTLYIPPEQVEAEYSIPRQTLANDRWKGRGIPYVKKGSRVYYARDDVEAYLAARKVRTEDAAA